MGAGTVGYALRCFLKVYVFQSASGLDWNARASEIGYFSHLAHCLSVKYEAVRFLHQEITVLYTSFCRFVPAYDDCLFDLEILFR